MYKLDKLLNSTFLYINSYILKNDQLIYVNISLSELHISNTTAVYLKV
jgi:hypothetical protein